MLKGIHPLLSPDLLHALAAMGHGDSIAIVDANFPATSNAKRLIESRGAGAPAMLEAVLTVLPLDTRVIPAVLAERDVIGCAQTGTGKTAAFVLPILHRLLQGKSTRNVRALILSPTR